MIFIYRILTIIFYPIIIIIIYLRKIFNKEDNYRYKEKVFTFNLNPQKDLNKKLIWLHAASIGEVQSVFPLIHKLNNEYKEIEFLITTVTRSAGDIVDKKFKDFQNIKHRYFPIDVNFLIKKFLKVWNPNLIILIDSEIWPNLMFQIREKKIPVILLNGRITKKTFKKWNFFPDFAKDIFSIFNCCLAASYESYENLKKLNTNNLIYIGNIKFSVKITKDDLINYSLETIKDKPFWCAASTHKGEETICIKTHIILRKIFRNIITIIIPRHINRSNEIKKTCNNFRLTSQILGENEEIQKNKEIIIINSFGNLPKFYNYSKSVLIGKSMMKDLQKVGGQNPIEAAKLGCKIYHGPYVYNFKEVYDQLETYKISETIFNEKDLSEKLIHDLKEPKGKENNMGENIEKLGKDILDKTFIEIKKFI